MKHEENLFWLNFNSSYTLVISNRELCAPDILTILQYKHTENTWTASVYENIKNFFGLLMASVPLLFVKQPKFFIKVAQACKIKALDSLNSYFTEVKKNFNY